MAELLSVSRLTAGYGRSVVLEDVAFDVHEGDSLAILGRNGVGKTTLLATLMGQTSVHRGSVRWAGTDLLRVQPARRAHVGLGWVPQERWVFRSLSVEENLTATARPGEWDLRTVYELFPRLAERRRNMGDQLSGGEQQMLAIARALMLNPRLLLLDEPMEGLAPLIVEEIREVIARLVTQRGLALVIVEHKAALALSIARSAIVLDRGRVVHASDSERLLADPAALDRMLGIDSSAGVR
jgi:branched-chain amino acid transport system ATP-binding protein